jgi:chromosome segregation ATPase
MSLQEAYREKMEAQLREWEADIARLQAKADQAKAEAKIEYYQQIEALRTKKAVAHQKLQELQETSEDAWEELKAGIENTWDDLRHAVTNALAKFKE